MESVVTSASMSVNTRPLLHAADIRNGGPIMSTPPDALTDNHQDPKIALLRQSTTPGPEVGFVTQSSTAPLLNGPKASIHCGSCVVNRSPPTVMRLKQASGRVGMHTSLSASRRHATTPPPSVVCTIAAGLRHFAATPPPYEPMALAQPSSLDRLMSSPFRPPRRSQSGGKADTHAGPAGAQVDKPNPVVPRKQATMSSPSEKAPL